MADKRITSRTKVYITRIGVRDWLVAVDSQKAALKAWDVHRNLFAEGAARVTSEPAHVELAMRSPGVPVAAPGRVPAGEAASNVVDLASRRKAPQKEARAPTGQAAPAAKKVPAKAKAPIPAPKPKPDRAKLDAAERELRAFERDAARRRGEIERRKRAVETELAAFDAETERRRDRLAKRVERERRAILSQG
jgi:hypothetical protein